MEEDVRPRGMRLRHGLEHWKEDVKLLSKGILDLASLRDGYKLHTNPIQVEVHDGYGKLKYRRYTHNLRTNDGTDWQARLMGGGYDGRATVVTGGTSSITAPTATTAGQFKDSAITSGPTLNQYIGYILVVPGATSVKYAHIVGNSAAAGSGTIWYFDGWFDSTPSGTVAAPSFTAGTTAYQILASQTPAFYVGLSTDATAPAVTDHLLASEQTANGLPRAYAAGAYSNPNGYQHTASTNTYSVAHQWTASATVTALQKCGMFTGFSYPNDAAADLANVGKGGGIMCFENTFASVNMATNDTLTLTWSFSY